MYIAGILAMMAIFLILYGYFNSGFVVVQVMLSIPLAFIGSIFAIYFTDKTVSLASIVAFVALCGISSRNGILMISHYLNLMAIEGREFGKEMILKGTLERLVPVLMTAISAILGLVPLLLAKGEPGKEILYPVAVVIVGGLFSSTLLDMWVTPAVFYKFGRKSAEKYVQKIKNSDKEKL
jgi:Cu(I)/Ag(I) efflux system membrane protein CusA/SilA